MGTENNGLIELAEEVRKKHGTESPEWQAAAKLVDASQARCEHAVAPNVHVIDAESARGKYQPGDVVVWCYKCSGVIEVVKPTNTFLKPKFAEIGPLTIDVVQPKITAKTKKLAVNFTIDPQAQPVFHTFHIPKAKTISASPVFAWAALHRGEPAIANEAFGYNVGVASQFKSLRRIAVLEKDIGPTWDGCWNEIQAELRFEAVVPGESLRYLALWDGPKANAKLISVAKLPKAIPYKGGKATITVAFAPKAFGLEWGKIKVDPQFYTYTCG